ncbi:type IV secretion system protein VirB3 [Bartonella tribocorum]|uniref:TrwM protein n=1 Tax=Bartonella tribocorum TaxID=85701 RepID=A0A2M6UW33_9HYPH|nr:VirB3 family type IV secretion system protein [Bartonella tribocorum]PIT70415.1 TrwM protein [Bartonella tribocorum]
MHSQEKKEFPLFKGATRVPTMWGVPMMPLIIMIMGVAVIAMTINIFLWVIAPPLCFIMAQITKNDDKAFRIWWLWIDTKFRNRNKGFWGASSYSPSNYSKRR